MEETRLEQVTKTICDICKKSIIKGNYHRKCFVCNKDICVYCSVALTKSKRIHTYKQQHEQLGRVCLICFKKKLGKYFKR